MSRVLIRAWRDMDPNPHLNIMGDIAVTLHHMFSFFYEYIGDFVLKNMIYEESNLQFTPSHGSISYQCQDWSLSTDFSSYEII